MLVAARDGAWAKSGYTAHDYVQVGLIAMWDGIENAGWGLHDADSTEWKDLTENHSSFSVSDDKWGVDCLIKYSNSVSVVDSVMFRDAVLSGNVSMEVVCRLVREYIALQDSTPICLCKAANSSSSRDYWFWCSSKNVWQTVCKRRLSGGEKNLEKLNISCLERCLLSFSGDAIYHNGMITNQLVDDGGYTDIGTTLQLGRLGGFNYFHGEICSIRLYNNNLSAEEIAHNYAVDKSRFGIGGDA